MGKMTIEQTTAYLVNLHDTKGNRLMSEDDVNRLIDDRLGAVIDSLNLGHIFGHTGKLELHKALRAKLPELTDIALMVSNLENAKKDAL